MDYPVAIVGDADLIWRLNHQRLGVWKLLPPQLEELEIVFNWPNVVFALGYAYHCQFEVLPTVAWNRGLNGSWIF
jgi:hypothetical protein